MKNSLKLCSFLTLVGLGLATGSLENAPLFWAELEAKLKQAYAHEQPEKIYLHLDQTFLEPGEDLWFAGYVLDAQSLGAAKANILTLELKNGLDQTLQSHTIYADDQGRFSGAIHLDEHLPWGNYALNVYFSERKQGPSFKRDITLFKPVLPRLSISLDYRREGYKAGDLVEAELRLKDLSGKALAKKDWKAEVVLSGHKPQILQGKTNAQGLAIIRFRLAESKKPYQDGRLLIFFDHQGQTESISRSIPMLKEKLSLCLYPEGGKLIAGFKQKIAFATINKHNHLFANTQVSGLILDHKGKTLGEFSSYHQGRGEFYLQAVEGESYQVKILKPEVFSINIPPAQKGMGLSLNSDNEVWQVKILSSAADSAYLFLQRQGKPLYRRAVWVEAGETVLHINSADFPMGICELNLLDAKQHILASRPVFSGLKRQIKVDIKAHKPSYLPGEEVRLDLHIQDSKGLPVSGHFSMAVVEEKRQSFNDDRQGRILSSLFLSSELSVNNPDFYFERDDDPQRPLPHISRTKALEHLLLCNPADFSLRKALLEPSSHPKIKQRSATSLNLRHLIDQSPLAEVQVYVNNKRYGQTDNKGELDLFLPQARNQTFELRLEKPGYWPEVFPDFDLSADSLKLDLQPQHLQRLNLNFSPLGQSPGPCETCWKLSIYTNQKPSSPQIPFVELSNDSLYLLIDKGDYAGLKVGFSAKPELKVQDLNLYYACTDNGLNAFIGTAGDTIWLRCDSKEPLYLPEDIELEKIVFSSDRLASRLERRAISMEVRAVKTERSRPTPKPALPESDELEDWEYDAEYIAGLASVRQSGPNPNLPQLAKDAPSRRTKVSLSLSERNQVQARRFETPQGQTRAKGEPRTDFRACLYFDPSVKVESGKGQVRFPTSDELTSFRVYLEGIDNQGRALQGKAWFEVNQALGMDLRLPPQVLKGDELRLPLSLHNRSTEKQDLNLSIELTSWLNLSYPHTQNLSLAPGEFKLLYLPIQVEGTGQAQIHLRLSDKHGQIEDELILPLESRSPNYLHIEQHYAQGDKLSFNLPPHDRQSLSLQLQSHNSGLKDILQTTKALQRLPSGCFEQSSSTNYPNTLVLNHIQKNKPEDEALKKQFLTYIKAGHTRLCTFESPKGGFALWPGAGPEPLLTAYGILQFTDMKAVFPETDTLILERSKAWLFSKYDGMGNFGASPVENMYILWALSEAGETQRLEKGRKIQGQRLAPQTEHPPYYSLSLLGNAAFLANDRVQAQACFEILKARIQKLGYCKNDWESGIMHSRGYYLDIETTALFALLSARLGEPELALKALNWIALKKSYCGYGNTQGTILYLKAKLAYQNLYPPQNKAQEVGQLKLNGQPLAQIEVQEAQTWEQAQNLLAQNLRVGHQELSLALEKDEIWSLELSYLSPEKPNMDGPIHLETRLERSQLKMGEYTQLEIRFYNKEAKTITMPMLMIGIPSGFSLSPHELKEKQEAGLFGHYEFFEGYLVLHFRNLPPSERKSLKLELKAEIPGRYQGPASSAFPYYRAQERSWIKGLEAQIEP